MNMRRNSQHGRIPRSFWLIVILIALSSVAMVNVSRAHPLASSNITIVNNLSLEIRHVYLSPTDRENWGPDQLNNSVISPGGSFALTNVACAQTSIKVIAEDQNGCFYYQVVSCAADSTWTIAANATPDCGQ